MKTVMISLTALLLCSTLLFSQDTTHKKAVFVRPPKTDSVAPVKPYLNFKLTPLQASQVVIALRNSTVLDAKTANSLADLFVLQANDKALQEDTTTIKPK